MQWSICVHSDETSGHEPDFPSQFSYLTNDNLCNTYTYALVGNNLNLLYAMINLCAFRRNIRTRSRFSHHNLVILGMISCANIYLCTH